MQELKVQVLGVRRYSFEDDNKRLVEGCTVHFIAEQPSLEMEVVGFVPSKANMPFQAFEHFIKTMTFPQLATVKTTQVLSGKGVNTKIIDFVPIKEPQHQNK